MLSQFQIDLPQHVFLLRHGETVWNRAGRIQGQLDSALTPAGRDQALRQGHTLKRVRTDIGIHHVFCSPLERAQSTAKLALGGEDFTTDPRISEISCGKWENTTHEQRLITDPDLAPAIDEDFDIYINAPGGEGLELLARRLASFLNELDRPAVIFSHKIALVVMRALLCDKDAPLTSSMAPPQGSILEICNGRARFHV